MRRLVYILLFIIMIGLSSAYSCYQESANVSTTCGGLNTGFYKNDQLGGYEGWAPQEYYLYDGNWSTYGISPYPPGGSEMISNYTIPNSAYGATLQWKTGAGLGNSSIPIECWNKTLGVLSIRAGSGVNSGGYSCYNFYSKSYSWTLSLSSSGNCFEEGIFWNVSGFQYLFNENGTTRQITPLCTVSTGIINASNFYDVATGSTNNLSCSLAGYISNSWVYNISDDNKNFSMNRAILNLTFTSPTNITMNWEGGGTTKIRNSSIYMNQSDIGYGTVSIVYNDGTQVYSYYNDNVTSITETLVITTNTPQLIKVQVVSGGTTISDALVRVKRTIVGYGSVQIYSTYTDSAGIAYVYGAADDTHTFIVSKDGYIENTKSLFIPEGFADTVTIQIQSTAGTITEQDKWYSNCGYYISSNKDCRFTADYTKDYTNITIYVWNYSAIAETEQCLNNDYCRTDEYEVTNSTSPIYALLYIDGVRSGSALYVNYEALDEREIQIDFDTTSINTSNTTRGIFYFITLIVGLFIAVSIEKKVKGWGLIAMMLWFIVIAYTIFPFYWLMVIPVAIINIMRMIRGGFTK